MSRATRIMMILTTIAAGACGGSNGGYGGITSPPPPDPRTVTATSGLAFTPSTLTVNAGETVTFAFQAVGHNVFFDAAAGAPGNIDGVNASTSATRVFATAGRYHYTCHIHPFMEGTVVVN
jgi:plastocyanin